MEKVKALGIKTVIDLRGDLEAVERPSAFSVNTNDIQYHQISLLEVNPAITRPNVPLYDIYKNSVETYGTNYAKVFNALAAIEMPAVFHCFLGKDRTGILASMLLSLAGVCKEDIIADYQVSGTYLEPFYKKELAEDTGLIWENSDDHLQSYPNNIATLHTFLEQKYGGVADYLRFNGVSTAEIEHAAGLLL
jgi:protein-tyrosine phosphatase